MLQEGDVFAWPTLIDKCSSQNTLIFYSTLKYGKVKVYDVINL